jgi:cytochrome c oxidase subunit 2
MHIDRLERYWIIAVGVVLGAFGAAIVASVVVFGVRLPSPVGRIDPAKIKESEFATPGLTQDGDHTYTLRVVAKMWKFDVGSKEPQPTIKIPAGSRLKIIATSLDVTHGFYVEQHDVNVMLLPGQISQVDVKFNNPGVFHIICHEYCGPGHQAMVAAIEVNEGN